MRGFRYPALILLSFFLITNVVYSKTDSVGIPLEENPRSLAINPNTNIAIATNEKFDAVSIVDLETQNVISTIPVGKAPRGVAIDKELNVALVSNSHDDTVSLIDLQSYQVIATISVGKEPIGVAIEPSTHVAFVANHRDNSVSVVDLETYNVIEAISVGQEPIDIAIDPEHGLALVANEKDYNVSVIDLNTNQVIRAIPVGKKPKAIDINPETHLAGVVNEKDNSITVINLLDWRISTIPVGKHPVDIALNQLDNTALVICDEDRSLFLIDLDTNAIIKNYALNKLPKGVAVNNFTNIAGVVDDKTDSLTLIGLPNPIPVISAISPDMLHRGDTNKKIAIKGSKFIKTSTVTIKDDTVSYSLAPNFIDNHNIEVEVPNALLEKTGNYRITVSNPAPDGGDSDAIELKVENPVPQVSLLDPMEAMAGTESLSLDIHGLGFFGDTEFGIGGEKRAVNYNSYRKVSLNLSAMDMEYGGYLDITASNPAPGGGTSSPATFTVLNPVPVLNSISPTEVIAKAPDFMLTLTGTNFVKTSSAKFSGEPLETTFVSKTELKAQVKSPHIQSQGDYPISVENPEPGGGISEGITLTVKDPKPEITGAEVLTIPSCYWVCPRPCDPRRDPSCVPTPPLPCYEYCPPPTSDTLIAGKQLNIKITGRNFTQDTVIKLNNSTISSSFTNSTSMSFSYIFPTGGTYAIVAETPLAHSDPYIITVPNPEPVLSGISPTYAVAGSGSFTLSVSGSNFVETSKILFNGEELPTIFNSATALTATVSDALTAISGDYPVTVTTPSPGGGISNPQIFSVKGPVIWSMYPESIYGGAFPLELLYAGNASEVSGLIIYGSNFINGSIVTLNGNALPIVSISEYHIEAALPQDIFSQSDDFPVVVTNPGGSQSNALTLTVLENPYPQIQSIPSALDITIKQSSLDIEGNFVKNSQIFIDGQPAEILAAIYYQNPAFIRIALPQQLYDTTGSHTIKVVSPAPGGGTAEATFSVVNPAPSLDFILPSTLPVGYLEGREIITIYLQASGIINESSLLINGAGGFPLTKSYGYNTYYANIPASVFSHYGDYELTISNPSPGGGASNPVTFTVVDYIQFDITQPSDGETVNRSKTLVKGTLESYGQEVTIKANGIVGETAYKSFNAGKWIYEWVVNSVPLQLGENIINIEAVDGYGYKVTKSITVHVNSLNSVNLSANITSGIPPLTTYFYASTELDYPVVNYHLDFGDGSIYNGDAFEGISHTYTAEGVCYPTLYVTDSEGNVFSDTIAINVLSRAEVDAEIKTVWEKMKGALSNGDIEGALNYFSEESRTGYREMFGLLSTQLPALTSQMREITMNYVKGDRAEYYIKRFQKGVDISYFIYFVKDDNGLWKIWRF